MRLKFANWSSVVMGWLGCFQLYKLSVYTTLNWSDLVKCINPQYSPRLFSQTFQVLALLHITSPIFPLGGHTSEKVLKVSQSHCLLFIHSVKNALFSPIIKFWRKFCILWVVFCLLNQAGTLNTRFIVLLNSPFPTNSKIS